jgi:hypothetical protein
MNENSCPLMRWNERQAKRMPMLFSPTIRAGCDLVDYPQRRAGTGRPCIHDTLHAGRRLGSLICVGPVDRGTRPLGLLPCCVTSYLCAGLLSTPLWKAQRPRVWAGPWSRLAGVLAQATRKRTSGAIGADQSRYDHFGIMRQLPLPAAVDCRGRRRRGCFGTICLARATPSELIGEVSTMSHAKQTSQRRSRTKAVTVLGVAGALSLAGGASGAAVGPPGDTLTENAAITLDEEEISDVSLSTFYVFDHENAGARRPGLQLAQRTRSRPRQGCGGCAGDCGGGGPTCCASGGGPDGSVEFERSSKRLGSPLHSGRSPHWVKVKNPKAPAVTREAEEDWGR